jgi:hypothetical protein
MLSLEYVRRHVEVQGFLGLDDDALRAVAPWLRFTPVMNILMIAGVAALGSVVGLAGAAAVMLVGAVDRAHPFDRLYDALVRRLTKTPRLPVSPNRRRLVFVFGATWLAVAAAVVAAGYSDVGRAMAMAMAVFIVPLATVHVCVVSEPIQLMVGPARGPDAP